MYAAFHMCTCAKKGNIFRQRRLNHSEMGEGDYGTQSRCQTIFLLAGLSFYLDLEFFGSKILLDQNSIRPNLFLDQQFCFGPNT